ncbi:MAG: PQQ-dependent sugar dehydrogenase [Thermoproteota archaeon]|nr:PQQ-dependent sugar dehydrogenase [Thermoproteota archaeon]
MKYDPLHISYRTNPSSFVIVLIASIALVVVTSLILSPFILIQKVAAQPSIIKDPNLKVESLVSGLSSPTSMAFVDNNHILVLEKDGNVRLVSNGQLQSRPVLHVSVDITSERGLLGIAVMNSSSSSTNNSNHVVFLYYTESQGGELRNRVYSYQWNGQSLINPKLILDLPALPGPNHNAGKLAIGPDNYLYVIIGELRHNGKLQNIKDGPDPDDTGVIFRVNPADGSPAKNNPFLNDPNVAMHRYYAYGIRNSFGIAFDPITGNLWETENGENTYDEINLIKPGFNGGWKIIMGPISRNTGVSESDLVNFPGSHYSDPVFSWLKPVAVTAIEFLKSTKLGPSYQNNMFVGDYKNGNLYFFKLNTDRTGIQLENSQQAAGLSDLVVDNKNELNAVEFGTGFGGITDIKTGPDGYLYVLSIVDGSIYRISPVSVPQ